MVNQAKLFLFRTRFVQGRISQSLYRTKFTTDPGRYNLFVDDKTQLCVQGFPRSANSFAFNALIRANPEVSRIARHIHTIGQIAVATRRKVPTLLVIREPTKTIASLINGYMPGDATCLLQAYVIYYEAVLHWCDDLVVSDFAKTTQNLDCAIDKLNASYGLHLRSPRNKDKTEAKDFLLDFSKRGAGVRGLAPYRPPEDQTSIQLSLEPGLLKRAEDAYLAVREHSV